ncbi:MULTISPECIES: hypothetical protein [unclassified Roseovarius]|uniref:hypothetical protein n=1 Tax=unclassified Roseovarius TaxID=2614913 RepID=UPI00273EDD9E|nr:MULTISPECIES: hypothetical protein [unclassified Roseovarius]
MIDYLVETVSNASSITIGLACGAFLLSISAWAEKEANDEIKSRLIDRIEEFVKFSSVSDVRDIVSSAFDAIFGSRSLSIRFISSSVILTTAWLGIISLFVAAYWHSIGELNETETLLFVVRDIVTLNAGAQYWVLVPILVVNYFGDLISIIFTRTLLSYITGALTLFLLLLVDVFASLLIYLASFNSVTAAYGLRTIWGFDEIVGVLLLRDADAAPELLLSTFSTTFWFLAIALGLLILHLSKKFYKFHNYKKRPFFFIGYLSTIPAFLVGVLVASIF